MKINISIDEQYPFYRINDNYSYSHKIIELTDEEYDIVKKGYDAFWEAHCILEDKYEASSNK